MNQFLAMDPANIALRFWARVVKTDGCWLWNGPKDRHGYGRLHVAGRATKAHRYAYETVVGPIPDGLTLDHLCRNPPCVNPAHLEPVTMRENILRSDGITAVRARQTHCVNGHPFDEANTYLRLTGGRACRTCSRANYHRVERLRRIERRRARRTPGVLDWPWSDPVTGDEVERGAPDPV